MKKVALVLFLIFYSSFSYSLQLSKLKSAQYGNLSFIVNNGEVFGLMEYYDEWDNSLNDYMSKTLFYLYGKYPSRITDTITLKAASPDYKTVNAQVILHKNDSITLFIPKDFVPGDGNPIIYDNGYTAHLDIDLTNTFKGLGIVKAEKSHFYNSPNDSAVTKAYIVKGDFVNIIEYRGNWIKIAYIPPDPKVNKRFVKWIKLADLYDKNPDNW